VFQAILLPEPTYKGPESIVYFRGNTLQEELKRDTKVRHEEIKRKLNSVLNF
jgi:propanediol dehydratase large subunit